MKAHYWIILILVAIIAYFLMCRKPVEIRIKDYVPVEVQQNMDKIKDSIAKHYQDSVRGVISLWKGKLKDSRDSLKYLQGEFLDQSDVFHSYINSLPKEQRDTACLRILSKVEYDSRKKDTVCNHTLALYDSTLKEQDVLIAAKDNQIAGKDESLKLAWEQQKKLERALRPRNQVYVGITVFGNRDSLIHRFGPNLGFKTKRDISFEVGALFNKNFTNNIYSFGIRKTIKL